MDLKTDLEMDLKTVPTIPSWNPYKFLGSLLCPFGNPLPALWDISKWIRDLPALRWSCSQPRIYLG